MDNTAIITIKEIKASKPAVTEPLNRVSAVHNKNIDRLRFIEAELETTQNNYNAVFNLAPVGYLVLYEDLEIKEVNTAAAKHLGTSRLNVLGNPFSIYTDSKYRDSMRQHFKRVFSGRDETFEMILLSNKGDKINALLHSSLIQDGPGNIRCCLCAITDLTDKAAAAKNITDHQKQLKHLQLNYAEELTKTKKQLEEHKTRHSHYQSQSSLQIEQLTEQLKQQSTRLTETHKQLREKSSQHAALLSELESQKNRLEKLDTDQSARFEELRLKLTKQIQDSENIASDLKTEKEKLSQVASEQSFRLKEMDEQLNQAIKEKQELSEQLVSEQRKLEKKNAEMSDLLKRKNQLSDNLAKQQKFLQEKNLELTDQLKRKNQLGNRLSQQQQELEKRNCHLKTKVEEKRQIAEYFEQKHKQLDLINTDLEEQLRSIQEKMHKQISEHKYIQVHLSEQKDKLKEMNDQKAQSIEHQQQLLEEHLDKSKITEAKLKNRIEQFRGYIKTVSAKLQRANDYIQHANADKNTAQEKLNNIQDKLENLLCEKENRIDTLQEKFNRQLTRYEQDNKSLKKELASYKRKHMASEKKLEEFKKRNDLKTEELKDLKNLLDTSQKNLNRKLKDKSRALKSANKKLQDEIAGHTETKNRLKEKLAELNSLSKLNESQASQLLQIRQSLDVHKNEKQQLKKEIKALQRENYNDIKKLRNNLEKATAQLEREIESHQQTRKSLSESRRGLTENSRLSDVGSWTFDLMTKQLEWSQELYRIFNLDESAEPVTFDRFLDFVLEDDREFVEHITTHPKFKRKKFSFQHSITLPNGGKRILLHNARRITDRENNTQKLIGTCQDISQWKAKEQGLTDQLKTFMQENDHNTARIEHVEKEIRQRAEQYRSLEKKILRENKDLRQQNHTVMAEMDAMNNLLIMEREENQAVEQEYTRQIEKLQGKITNYKEELSETKAKLEDQQSQINNLCQEIELRKDDLKDKDVNTDSRIQEMTMQIELHQETINILESEKQQLTDSLEQAENLYDEAQKRFTQEIIEHKNIQQELFDNQSVLKDSISRKQNEIDNLSKHLSTLESKINNLPASQVSNHPCDSEFDELNAILSERSEDLENTLFAASVGISNPLENLNSFTERIEDFCSSIRGMLQSGPVDGRLIGTLKEHTNNILPKTLGQLKSSLREINNTIHSIHQISQTNTDDIIFESLNVNLIIQDIIDELKNAIQSVRIDVNIGDLPSCVADAIQLKNALFQIIDNAVKFRKTTCPRNIDITGWIEGQNSIYCIEDNGIGMNPEDIDAAFGMFRKISQNSDGKGVGLAVVKRVIDNLNGQISVESQPEQGTKFYIILPHR